MKSQHNSLWVPLLLSVIFGGIIWNIGYNTPRENFPLFISQFLIAFSLFYYLWLNKFQIPFKYYLFIAIALRLILLPQLPSLSPDYYRFIWDGELLTRGVNPFAHTPNDLISHNEFMMDSYMRQLYHGMTPLSQEHFSCYPVLNQFIFAIPAFITESLLKNIMILKSFIIFADIGTIFIGRKLLLKLNLSPHLIWLYALNPFIILEFSGNIHFEGVMIFFLVTSLYYLMSNKWLMSALFLALAVHIKLIPLILLPFVFKKLKWKKSLGFTSAVLLFTLLIGSLLLNQEFFNNMMSSVNEYFVSFEFNAGIYAIFKEIGIADKGWNPIETLGPFLRNIGIFSIILLAVFKKYRSDADIIKGMLFAFVIYYSFATTVHPWYISLVLILSIFTKYKFGLVWSILVMLSYYAYSNPTFEEDTSFRILEYLIVYSILFVEVYKYTKRDNFGIQFKEFFSKEKITKENE